MDLEQMADEFREVGARRVASLRTLLIEGAEFGSINHVNNVRYGAKIQGVEMMLDTFDELWDLVDK